MPSVRPTGAPLLSIRNGANQAMISHEQKFIFIHIPKTAGTSVEKTFELFKDLSKARQDHRTIREIQPLASAISGLRSTEDAKLLARRGRDQYRRLIGQNLDTVNAAQYKEYFKFTIVRNPWARAASWYQNVMRGRAQLRNSLKIDSDCTFATFIDKHPHQWGLKPQLYWLKDSASQIPMDFIGRFENLQADFDTICKQLDVEVKPLSKMLTKGTRTPYKDLYDSETEKKVRKMYEEEIELFKYKFD